MANDLYNDLPLTSFPQNIDSFTTWLNVTAQDGPLIQQYITAMNAGNQAQANQILTQISSGSQKIIKATDLNKLTQAILAVERFYSVDIRPYVQNKQEEWLNIINQFSYVGAWSNGTAYVQNNIVSYIVSGVTLLFIATSNPPTGTVPTNTQYWRPLSVQGTAGESGPGLSYRQEWNSSTPYSVNDCVTYSGAVWMALQANKNIIPWQNESYWKNIISFGTVAYPIQDTEPTDQAAGGLWFNTQDNPTNYVYLEPLNNPAGAGEIVNGYEAYNDNGKLVTGTANYLPITGGTMKGNINMGTFGITGVGVIQSTTIELTDGTMTNSPRNSTDLTNKQYVDNSISDYWSIGNIDIRPYAVVMQDNKNHLIHSSGIVSSSSGTYYMNHSFMLDARAPGSENLGTTNPTYVYNWIYFYIKDVNITTLSDAGYNITPDDATGWIGNGSIGDAGQSGKISVSNEEGYSLITLKILTLGAWGARNIINIHFEFNSSI